MKNQNQTLIVVIAVLVIGALVVGNYTGVININLQSYSTTNKQFYGPNDGTVIGSIKGKEIFAGRGEITAQENYLSTWLNSGVGEKIVVTPHADYWNAWWKGFLGVGNVFNQPGVLVGRYWFTATLTDASGTHNIIWAGGFDSNYMEIAPDSPTGQYGFAEFGHLGKRPWASLYGQYKNAWGGAAGTNGPACADGFNKWWSNPFVESYNKYELGLEGTSLAFYMKAGVQGTVVVNVYADYATWHQESIYSAHYDLFEGKLLQTDSFIIKSSTGDIDVQGTNSYKYLDTGAIAGGTHDVYTKYLFQEGSTVSLHIDVDYSRPEMYKGWKVQVVKPGDILFKEMPIPDKADETVSFQIPDGSFVLNGNNEWKVKLINPALQTSTTDTTPQAEFKIFVIDTYEHAPSETVMTVSPSMVTEGKQVTIVCSAYRNQKTQSAITSFRLTGRWKSITNGQYVFDTSIPKANIVQSGEKFTGTYTYTASSSFIGGTVKVMANAIDLSGRAGGEGWGNFSITAQPAYEVVFTVVDSATNEPIVSANVWFNNVKKVTHSDGTATFDVVSGQYVFSVDATGYNPYANELLTVGANIPKTIKLDSIGGTGGTGGETNGTGGETGGTGNSLTVQVYDDSTWGTVTGALVTVGDQVGTTDSSGSVVLTLAETKENPITVTAIGYQDYSSTVTVDQLQGGQTAAYLTPSGGVPGGDVAPGGTPDDQNGNGVPDTEENLGKTVIISVTDSASNTVSGLVGLGDASQMTIDGKATFRDVSAGSYTVTVSASGYEGFSDSLIFSDTDAAPITKTCILTATSSPPSHEDPDDTTPVDQKSTVTVTVTNGDTKTVMKIDGAIQYGKSATFLISSGIHTLTVGRAGYIIHTEQITIPDKLSYSVTLTKLSVPPTDADQNGNGIPDSQEKGFAQLEWLKDPMVLGIIAIIAIVGIIGVAVILRRKR